MYPLVHLITGLLIMALLMVQGLASGECRQLLLGLHDEWLCRHPHGGCLGGQLLVVKLFGQLLVVRLHGQLLSGGLGEQILVARL